MGPGYCEAVGVCWRLITSWQFAFGAGEGEGMEINSIISHRGQCEQCWADDVLWREGACQPTYYWKVLAGTTIVSACGVCLAAADVSDTHAGACFG